MSCYIRVVVVNLRHSLFCLEKKEMVSQYFCLVKAYPHFYVHRTKRTTDQFFCLDDGFYDPFTSL